MIPYKEGTLFAVPLRRGGYAVGVVARTSPQGKIFLAYLFGPARASVPSVAEVQSLRPQDALRVGRIGDLSLMDKTWPIIGELAAWKRDDWPMPPFVRREDITKQAWLVKYSDRDASRVVSEEPIDYPKVSEFERDALMGAGAAEIVMTKMLSEAGR